MKHLKYIREKRIHLPSLSSLIMVAVLLVIVLIGGLFARFAYNKIYLENRVGAKDFYFTVDLLGDTTTVESLERDIHIYGGETAELKFKVQNYFDNKRVTEYNLKYDISYACDKPEYTGCSLTLADGSAITANGNQMDGGGKKTNEYKLMLPLGYKEETKVTVYVSSTSPYTKNMEVRFILHPGEADLLYRVEDIPGAPFAELIIMANKPVDAGKLVVDWSDINNEAAGFNKANLLQVDTTNEYLLDTDADKKIGLFNAENNKPEEYESLTSIKTTKAIRSLESISIYFFKKDPNQDYSTEKTPASNEYVDLPFTSYNSETGVYTITLTKE